MRVELERGVNYNAKVAHFAHGVNRLVINNVINVAGVDITHNAGALSYRYRPSSCSLEQSCSLSRLLCRFTKSWRHLMYTFIRSECRNIQKSSKTQNVKKKAMPTLNTELTKNYHAMQGLL